MSTLVSRSLRGRVEVARVRTASLRGRQHLVVPVIMLVGDSVIQASNAPGPELVPSDVLAAMPQQWNGRPLVANHPTTNGGSANSPALFASAQFGAIWNTTYRAGKLLADAYIDVARAEELGGDAAEVVRRLRAGELVDVSVGAMVYTVPQQGRTAAGETYVAVWQALDSDHLALLPSGVSGACSLDLGCGAPRAATRPSTPVSTSTAPAAGQLRAACGHSLDCQCNQPNGNTQETRTMSNKVQAIINHYEAPNWDGSPSPDAASLSPGESAELQRTLALRAARRAGELYRARQERAEQRAAAAGGDDLEAYRPKGGYRIAELQEATRQARLDHLAGRRR